MCDPVSVISVVGLGIEVTSKVIENQAQKKASRANATAADNAAKIDTNTLSIQETQQKDAAATTIMQADRQARMADATARVSAGEAGVAGASVDALLGDIQRQDSEFKTQTQRNLDGTLTQIEREKMGVATTAANRKAAVPFPSDFATGLQIAGAGLNFASGIVGNRPKPGKG